MTKSKADKTDTLGFNIIGSLNQEQRDKIIRKATEQIQTDQNIDSLVDFAIFTAERLDLDFAQMPTEEQLNFVIFTNSYFMEFLNNYLQFLDDEEIQENISLYIKSGFNDKFLKEDSKLSMAINMVMIAYFQSLEDELDKAEAEADTTS
jgi:hypothetical protein